MAEKQSKPIAPPVGADRDSLTDFSSVIQDNLSNLFRLAHRHHYRTAVPASNEGVVGDIYLVEINSTFSLYAKFPSGWKSVALT